MSETTEKLPPVIINFVDPDDPDGKLQITTFTDRYGKGRLTSIKSAPIGHYRLGEEFYECKKSRWGTRDVFTLTLVTVFVCDYICFPDGTLLLAYFKDNARNVFLSFSGEQVMSSGGRFTLNGFTCECKCVIDPKNGNKYYNVKKICKEVNTPVTILQDDEKAPVTILQDDEKAPVTIPQDDEKAPAVEKKDVTYVSDKGETFGYILAFFDGLKEVTPSSGKSFLKDSVHGRFTLDGKEFVCRKDDKGCFNIHSLNPDVVDVKEDKAVVVAKDVKEDENLALFSDGTFLKVNVKKGNGKGFEVTEKSGKAILAKTNGMFSLNGKKYVCVKVTDPRNVVHYNLYLQKTLLVTIIDEDGKVVELAYQNSKTVKDQLVIHGNRLIGIQKVSINDVVYLVTQIQKEIFVLSEFKDADTDKL